ncbi:MAG: cysteine synthase family protein [Phycisphaeraceae bacterium]
MTITNVQSAVEQVGPVDQRHRLIDMVGNTPLIELKCLSDEVAPVRIMAKAEWYNPGGSVKDRAALNMLLTGEREGRLTKDKIILDATSGNTGIAYAMFGAAMGYRVQLAIPKSAGALHKRILQAYGAELILTPATEGSDGAIVEAIRLYKEDPDRYFYPDQYNNDANWQAHYNGTGLEIIAQTQGEITHFIAGLGTSGTFTGCGRRLKEFNSDIHLISCQPDSPMHGLEGWKHMPTSIKPGFYNETMAEENIGVPTEEAQDMVKRLAREEGLLVGLSAGASVWASLQVAKRIKQGLVVTVMADNASKYLDHNFWE